MKDYGTAWRALRPSSVTDQVYIKINRLRTIQMTGEAKVEETQQDGFIAVVNYAIIALIQLNKGTTEDLNESPENVLDAYDYWARQAEELMIKKNHDYGEAWRQMRISSITDLIYQKVLRTKQIEDNTGKTLVSEGLEANYLDMLNYALFCLILLEEQNSK